MRNSRRANPTEQPRLVNYQLRRKTSMRMRTEFILLKDGIPIKCAKLKGKSDCLPIGEGWHYHYGSSHSVAVIEMSNRRRTFMLKTPEGAEVMSVHYAFVDGVGTPRDVTVAFNTAIPGIARELVNRKPNKNNAGAYQMSFEGRFAVKSVKNCLLTDENDHPMMIAVKVGRNWIGLDARNGIDANAVFCFGVSCFHGAL
jgi:hypothetical protein